MVIKPVYMATAGDHADYCVLAVFADRDDAERYVNHHNEQPWNTRRHPDNASVEAIPFYLPGAWQPRGDVIDGEIVALELEA